MAFSPVSVIASNYRDFSGYFLKAYEPGTTTPKTMAIDADGNGSAAKFELNVNSFFVTSGGAIVNPHVDGSYDLWLFPTEAEADANDTVNAKMLADDLSGIVTGSGQLVNVLSRDTLNDAVIDASLQDGLSINLKERTTGNGGGALWDVVLASSVTPNTFNIVICTGVPTLALVLRITNGVNVKEWGAFDDGDTTKTDNTAVFLACKAECIAEDLTLVAEDGNFWFPADIDLWGVRKIDLRCSIRFDNATDKIIVGGNTVAAPNTDIFIMETQGTIQVYGMNRGKLRFIGANTLWIFADAAVNERKTVSYCDFEWVNVDTFRMGSSGSAFINDNKFYGDRVRVNVLFDGDYPINNNIFYGMTLESIIVDILSTNGTQGANSNFWHDVRLEGTCTFNFSDDSFNNIFWQTWSNFPDTMMWDVPSGNYIITNPGNNNRIASVHHAYTEKDAVTIYDINNLGNSAIFEIDPVNSDKISITRNAADFFDTGLMPVDDKLWVNVTSGETASFHVFMEVFDLDGNPITTEPTAGFKTSQGTTIWNAAGYWWYNNPVNGGNFAANPSADSSVKYVRFRARTSNGAVGDEHTRIHCEVIQPQENKTPVKNLAEDVIRIDTVSNKVIATSESTALDLLKFTSGSSTQSEAVGVLSGTLTITMSAEKGSTEDAATATLPIQVAREDSGILTITTGTETLLSNGGSLQIDSITLATKAGATISEAILTIQIGTNMADPFDALSARARVIGLADFHINGTYLIAAEKA